MVIFTYAYAFIRIMIKTFWNREANVCQDSLDNDFSSKSRKKNIAFKQTKKESRNVFNY